MAGPLNPRRVKSMLSQKTASPVADFCLYRDAGERREFFLVAGLKRKRDQTGLLRPHVDVELPGNLIAQGACACRGQGESAGGDDQRRTEKFAPAADYFESMLFRLFNFHNGRAQENGGTGLPAFRQEHIEDIARAVVAKKFSPGLFAVPYVMLVHKIQEIVRCVAAEGRSAKVRIAGDIVFGLDGAIGKIAAPAAGN